MVYIELTLCLPGNVKNNAKHKHDFTSMAKSSELPGKYEKQNLRWIVTHNSKFRYSIHNVHMAPCGINRELHLIL